MHNSKGRSGRLAGRGKRRGGPQGLPGSLYYHHQGAVSVNTVWQRGAPPGPWPGPGPALPGRCEIYAGSECPDLLSVWLRLPSA